MDHSELSLSTPVPVAPPSSSGLLDVHPSQTGESPFGEQRRTPTSRLRGRIGSALAAIGALVAKFFATIKGAVLLLPKVKLLTTAGTALVSVAAYSLFFGWTFAVGFVILLFVHEMGHVLQLR